MGAGYGALRGPRDIQTSPGGEFCMFLVMQME